MNDKTFWQQWNKYISADAILKHASTEIMTRKDIREIGYKFNSVGSHAVLWMRAKRWSVESSGDLKSYWIFIVRYGAVDITVSTSLFCEKRSLDEDVLLLAKKANLAAKKGDVAALVGICEEMGNLVAKTH